MCFNGDCKLNEQPWTGDSWFLLLPVHHQTQTLFISSHQNIPVTQIDGIITNYIVYTTLPACNTTGNGGVRILFNDDHIHIVDNNPWTDYVQIVDSIGVREKQRGEYNDLVHTVS